jgi:hypothetical protein
VSLTDAAVEHEPLAAAGEAPDIAVLMITSQPTPACSARTARDSSVVSVPAWTYCAGLAHFTVRSAVLLLLMTESEQGRATTLR